MTPRLWEIGAPIAAQWWVGVVVIGLVGIGIARLYAACVRRLSTW